MILTAYDQFKECALECKIGEKKNDATQQLFPFYPRAAQTGDVVRDTLLSKRLSEVTDGVVERTQ